jgi:nucleotide-binding universal stress UspA family protein
VVVFVDADSFPSVELFAEVAAQIESGQCIGSNSLDPRGNDRPRHHRGSGEFAYELLIAGMLHRETDDKPFAGDVARELLRNAPCDLLLVPRPLEEPTPPQHIVFAFEPKPEEEDCESLRRAAQILRPRRVTIAIPDTPFTSAIATSRGEEPQDLEVLLKELADPLAEHQVEIDRRVVTSITGYTVCETVERLEADLLVIKAEPNGLLPHPHGLVVSGDSDAAAQGPRS